MMCFCITAVCGHNRSLDEHHTDTESALSETNTLSVVLENELSFRPHWLANQTAGISVFHWNYWRDKGEPPRDVPVKQIVNFVNCIKIWTREVFFFIPKRKFSNTECF